VNIKGYIVTEQVLDLYVHRYPESNLCRVSQRPACHGGNSLKEQGVKTYCLILTRKPSSPA
jgi:hypothetical protein